MLVLKDRWYRSLLSRAFESYRTMQRDRHETACHEAAHAVVAHHLGRDVIGVYLRGSRGWRSAVRGVESRSNQVMGLCTMRAVPPSMSDYHDIAIDAAGFVGSTLAGYAADDVIRGCTSDIEEAMRVVKEMAIPGRTLTPYWHEAAWLARSILMMDVGRFSALAQYLVLHGSIEGDFAAFYDDLDEMDVDLIGP